MQKWPLLQKAFIEEDDFASDQSTSGGSSDTELKLLAVTPMGSPVSDIVVTIVTPVAKVPKAAR